MTTTTTMMMIMMMMTTMTIMLMMMMMMMTKTSCQRGSRSLINCWLCPYSIIFLAKVNFSQLVRHFSKFYAPKRKIAASVKACPETQSTPSHIVTSPKFLSTWHIFLHVFHSKYCISHLTMRATFPFNTTLSLNTTVRFTHFSLALRRDTAFSCAVQPAGSCLDYTLSKGATEVAACCRRPVRMRNVVTSRLMRRRVPGTVQRCHKRYLVGLEYGGSESSE